MKLSLGIGKETTDKEREYIDQVFSEFFDVEMNDDHYRFSEIQYLPLVIHLFVDSSVSGAIWDSLKFAIQKLFANIGTVTNRHAQLVIRTKDKEAVVTEKGQVILEREKTVEISNVDELLEILKASGPNE